MTDTPRETILADIRERLAKAGGPWRLTRRYPMMVGHGIALQRAREIQHEAETGQVFGLYIGRAHDLPLDAFEFIAHAPDDIRTLLAECDTLRAQLAETRDQVSAAEHERSLIAADTQRGITDCSTPIFQRVRNIVEYLAQAEAQLAAREGEIATLKEENDELTRRDSGARSERQPAASSNGMASDREPHRDEDEMRLMCGAEGTPRTVHGGAFQEREEWDDPVVCTLGYLHDGPHIAEDVYGHVVGAWPAAEPQSDPARPTDSATGTATGSATNDLRDLQTKLAAAEARADTAEAQLRKCIAEIYGLRDACREAADTGRMGTLSLTSREEDIYEWVAKRLDLAPPITKESQPHE